MTMRASYPNEHGDTYYDLHEPDRTVSVLGQEYSIYLDVSKHDDKLLETSDGYCDMTAHRIVVCDREDSDFADFLVHRNVCLRHELIHAFLFESGIGANTKWDTDDSAHPEHMVEWMAMQFPKIIDVFRSLGVDTF